MQEAKSLSNPPKKREISREEIRAVYAQGEDAVIALVEGLLERSVDLEQRVEALENQQSKDSRNSSKPPASDGFGRRTKSLRTRSGRSSGGQEGHPGSTLEWREDVDEVIVHSLSHCQECGTNLEALEVTSWDVRQVQDIAPMRLQVTEHQAEVKSCPHCQSLNRGCFPGEVNSVVQYGAQIKGLMVYLLDYQLLPSERVRQLISDVFGCELSDVPSTPVANGALSSLPRWKKRFLQECIRRQWVILMKRDCTSTANCGGCMLPVVVG